MAADSSVAAFPRERSRRTKLEQVGYPLVVAAVHALAILWVVSHGFQAVSDDDFARVSIAQRFAHQPKLDPTQSSWLPFPFWVVGTLMRLSEPSFAVAKATSWALSCAASVLVFYAARLCGLTPLRALIAGVILAIFPYSVWLGAAAIPDGYTAGLCLFAVVASAHPRPALHWTANACLFAATLSRYEAWPVAFTVSGLNLMQLRTEPQLSFGKLFPRLLTASAASAGPLLWLLHGAVNHGDMFFFVQRVAGYKRALGLGARDVVESLCFYPELLLKTEPALMALVVLGAAFNLSAFRTPRMRRLLLTAAAVLAFLIWGNLKDGAPTHHPERPLMLVWFALGVAGVNAMPEIQFSAPGKWTSLAWLCPLLLLPFRSSLTDKPNFLVRNAELEIAEQARPLVDDDKVLIAHPDYGYFAIMVGLRDPARSAPLRHHDPRHPEADPFRSQQALERQVVKAGARWLIVDTKRLAKAEWVGTPVRQSADFALLRLKSTDDGK